ncbi:MAG TPA: DUF1801 domain-containing protein [Candidatus Limnocylindrales bacterium]|nr:DUF1801 domain-containing protein [Candidatus Limnocylindrales bacterium]
MPETTREGILAATPDTQRAELEVLDAAIRAAAPRLETSTQDGFLGYGRYWYRYASGREGDWYALSLVPRAANLTLYVGAKGVEAWGDRLPKGACGKGCIRVKKASDIPPDVIGEIAAWASEIDGRLLDWKGLDQHTDPPVIRDR